MVDIVERPPTLREYKDLREVCGWGNVSDESTQVSIDNALYSVCLEENKRIVALAESSVTEVCISMSRMSSWFLQEEGSV